MSKQIKTEPIRAQEANRDRTLLSTAQCEYENIPPGADSCLPPAEFRTGTGFCLGRSASHEAIKIKAKYNGQNND